MMHVEFELVRYKFFEAFFNGDQIFAWADFLSVLDPKNMGVDRNGGLTERSI